MLRTVILLLVLAGTPAMAQAAADAPGAGFDAVRAGLAYEMTQSAEALTDGHRHDATKALDRALHLAEFATTAFALPEKSGPFHDAHKAIKNARHALQMGRPEEATRILAEAGEVLGGAPLPDLPDAGLTLEQAEIAEGRFVLNATGHRLGELNGVVPTADESAAMAIIGHGGWGGIGEQEVQVPLRSLLGSHSFLVLPSTVSPEEFARQGG